MKPSKPSITPAESRTPSTEDSKAPPTPPYDLTNWDLDKHADLVADEAAERLNRASRENQDK